jgi:hypothetical protein
VVTLKRVGAAGLAYFAIVFAAGFVFGVVRERWAIGALGARAAELAEIPLMIGVVILAAMWVVVRFGLRPTAAQRLGTGLLALALLVGAELGVVLGVRELTLEEYLDSRDPLAFAAYLAALLLYAVMPAMVRSKRLDVRG